jgi:pimeloyl-ACP methyl ester carboxylesterase
MLNWAFLLVLGVGLVGCGANASDIEGNDVAEVAAELGAKPQVKRLALSTGVTLAYSEQGARRGAPVIFLHGFTASHRHFDLNLPIFPRGFHVFALDLRGHGDSDKPDCCYSHADFVADVVAFMDALSLRRASLVGHSMGSLIAHEIAVDFPERVEKLVLMGSAPTAVGSPSTPPLQMLVAGLSDPIDPVFVRQFEQSIFFGPVPDSFIDTATAETLKIPAAIWQKVVAGITTEDHSAALAHIRAPTLLLWGDKDTIFSESDQEKLLALIPDSRLIIYPQVGHGLHVERPHRTVHDVASFLR